MIHLYAVTAATLPTRHLAGLEGASVTTVACGTLHAAVSRHERPPEANQTAALAHAAVVDRVSGLVPAVPVRFGVHHRSDAGLRAAISRHADELHTTLDRVGDHVEFMVRFANRPPPAPAVDIPNDATTPGLRYLHQRMAEERAARDASTVMEQQLREATAELAEQAVAVVERAGIHGPERCFLVPRSQADRFRRSSTRTAAHDRVVIGGPWPPYTFAAVEGPV